MSRRTAKKRSDAEKDEIYRDWKELINMGPKELEEWAKDPDRLKASISRQEAKEDHGGIHSGYDSLHRIKRRAKKPRAEWTDEDYDNAAQENGFNSRMLGNEPGEPVGDTGRSKWEISLRNWGHSPSKASSPAHAKYKAWKKKHSAKRGRDMSSEKQLRKEIIRIAYTHPEMRSELLALLHPARSKRALQLPYSQVILAKLNSYLRDQMTAIAQYMVHAEMCANWGYARLSAAAKERAFTEMRHSEALIERIIFLEGTPEVGLLNEVFIGKTVQEQLQFDLEAEQQGVAGYNEGIAICDQVRDHGTRQLLEANLKDEEKHHDWLQSQLDQISQMGIANYLAAQTDG